MCVFFVFVWGLCFSSIAAGAQKPSWSHKGSVNVWLTDNCHRSMGRIKTEQRTQRSLTCWHVLLSAFQGGFSVLAPLCRDRRDNHWMGLTILEAVGELYSQPSGPGLASFSRRGRQILSVRFRGFRESVLNQTNTVEFLPLLAQRFEWQGCGAELPVSPNDSGSKCDHP